MTGFEKKSVLEVLKKAGEIMLSAHGIESENGVTVKPGNANFVTVYDVKIQDYIISEIKKVFTDAVFIAEEKDNDAAVLQSEHCFVIDPIDGTTNFIRDLSLLLSRGYRRRRKLSCKVMLVEEKVY